MFEFFIYVTQGSVSHPRRRRHHPSRVANNVATRLPKFFDNGDHPAGTGAKAVATIQIHVGGAQNWVLADTKKALVANIIIRRQET